MSKGLEKELDYLMLAKNNLWTVTLTTFSGSFGIVFLNIPILIKIILVSIGFTASTLFLDNYFKKDDKIEKIIKILKQREG